MKKNMLSKKFFIFSGVLLLILGFGLFSQKLSLFSVDVKVADAASSGNVSGWAWANTPQSSGTPTTGTSQGIGWISFNCTNIGSCATSNYGVNINPNTGDFSGYAWGANNSKVPIEGIGWISFNRSDTGNPPSADIGSGSGAIANVNVKTGKVTGWARALSGKVPTTNGFDGWIKLSGSWTNGVSLNTVTRKLSGYAWGGTVIGWVNFNPSNSNTGNVGVAFTGKFNQPPLLPTVTGPSTGLAKNSIAFKISASDPDNDNVKYLIDWNNNGTIDQTLPSTGNIANNTTLSVNHTWNYTYITLPSLSKTVTIAVKAEDSKGAIGPISYKTIKISIPQCSDGKDNDGDKLVDAADPGCWVNPLKASTYNPQDNNETNPQCFDGKDNDKDGLKDAADPGCWTTAGNPATYNAAGTSENNCGNGLCEASTKENFVSCPVDCHAKLKEF